jgi:hypothetical protein
MEALQLDSNPTPHLPSASGVVETCVAEINEAVHSCKGWAVQAGLLLLSAKAKLVHGQWSAMFESGRLDVTVRVAEMLMKIAGHPTLANPKYFSDLPQAWSVLYELSKLPPQMLEGEIHKAAVHPDLKHVQARQIVQRVLAQGGASKPKLAVRAFNFQRRQQRLTSYLAQQAASWPLDQHERLAGLLEETARKLRTGGHHP